MRGWLKKLVTGISVVAMAVGMMGGTALTAKAEETNYPADSTNCSITINNITGVHTYEAYQIFGGDVHEVTTGEGESATTTRTLSNVIWGDAIHSDNLDNRAHLLGILQGNDSNFTSGKTWASYFEQSSNPFQNFTVNTPASDVLKTIESVAGNDSSRAKTLAKVFYDAIFDKVTQLPTPSGSGTNEEGTTSATIKNLKPGYYIVIDQSGTHERGYDDESKTSVILRVVGQETITPKEDVPTLTKKVWNPYKDGGAGWDNYTYAGTGDTITYKLTTTLPSNFEDYNVYKNLVFADSADLGITFCDANNVKIYAGKDDLTTKEIPSNGGYKDITSLFDDNNINNITVRSPYIAYDEEYGFNENGYLEVASNYDLKGNDAQSAYHFTNGTKIIVLYTAKLNRAAEAGQGRSPANEDDDSNSVDLGKGNRNVAKLKFPNDPNKNNEDTYGMTPDASATVYTFKFRPVKYHDEVKTENAQPGAMFTLYKAKQSGSKLVKDEDDILGFGVSGNDGKITFYKAATSTTEPAEGNYSTIKKSDGSVYYVSEDVAETNGDTSEEGEDPGEEDDIGYSGYYGSEAIADRLP